MRADNADLRLTERGYEGGLVGEERMDALRDREAQVASALGQLQNFKLPIRTWISVGPELDLSVRDGSAKTAAVSPSRRHPGMAMRFQFG